MSFLIKFEPTNPARPRDSPHIRRGLVSGGDGAAEHGASVHRVGAGPYYKEKWSPPAPYNARLKRE